MACEIVRKTHQNASFSREKKFLGRGTASSPDPTPVGKRRLAREPAAFLNHFKHCLQIGSSYQFLVILTLSQISIPSV